MTRRFVLSLGAWGLKPLTHCNTPESIALAYGIVRMGKKNGIEWKKAKLEPLGAQAEGGMPTNILR